MHENFLDLTPQYKREKAERKAEKMQSKLGEKLSMFATKNFNEQLKKGGTLTGAQLGNLNGVFKK